MLTRKLRNYGVFCTSAVLAFSLSACASGGAPALDAFDLKEPSQSTDGEAGDVLENMEGPLAAADRKIADRLVNEAGDAVSVDIDFGNVVDGQFAAPLRGLLVVPKPGSKADKKFADAGSPLVVISHLRAPACANGVFAYPCAPNVEEYRFDRGMAYYGKLLAEQGYTVVIPDVAGIFVGADVSHPYDQNAMWKQSVSKFVDSLKSDIAGSTDVFGVKDLPKVDFNNVGLLLHSRSGTVVEPALEVFGKDHVKSVFAYGPAYDTVELADISPLPADVPYLALVGEDDADVGASANLWLGHYLPTPRKTPAAVVAVPGLGHMFINQAAADAGTDDRRGCDLRHCPDAAEHQRVLKEVGLEWFNATLAGSSTVLPLQASAELPDKVAGLPARWLAYSPKPLASVSVSEFKGTSEQSLQLCVNPDPMNPIEIANPCPEAEEGVVQILTQVGFLKDAAAEVSVSGARGLALHVAPVGTPVAAGAPLEITLTLASGAVETVQVPASHPALRGRVGDGETEVYQLGTVRLPLPDSVSKGVVKRIQVKAPAHPVELKSVDFF